MHSEVAKDHWADFSANNGVFKLSISRIQDVSSYLAILWKKNSIVKRREYRAFSGRPATVPSFKICVPSRGGTGRDGSGTIPRIADLWFKHISSLCTLFGMLWVGRNAHYNRPYYWCRHLHCRTTLNLVRSYVITSNRHRAMHMETLAHCQRDSECYALEET